MKNELGERRNGSVHIYVRLRVYIIVFVSNQSDNPSPGPAAGCVSGHLFIYTYCAFGSEPEIQLQADLMNLMESHTKKIYLWNLGRSRDLFVTCKWKYANKLDHSFVTVETEKIDEKNGRGKKWIKCSLLLELCVCSCVWFQFQFIFINFNLAAG